MTAPKFCVYQNPTLSAALTSRSLGPSPPAILVLVLSLFSSISLYFLISRRIQLSILLAALGLTVPTAGLVVTISAAVVGLVFTASLMGFVRALALWYVKNVVRDDSKNTLSGRQMSLLGLKPTMSYERAAVVEPVKKARKLMSATSTETLVPIRSSSFRNTHSRSPRIGLDRPTSSTGKVYPVSPASPSYTSHNAALASPGTPWSRKSPGSSKRIQTEAMLEQYLADLEEEENEPLVKVETPLPAVRGFFISNPSSVATQSTPSGAARSTPLRPARLSPGSHQKYNTPPKKGEGELPPPMSIEQAAEAFERVGIYSMIDQLRDRLRQWFSSALMRPLLEKIESSHIQVMQAAMSISVSITVSQVGSELPDTVAAFNLSPIGGSKDWLPTVTIDEDGVLNQLRASLLQARDRTMSQAPSLGMQQPQPNPLLPAIQSCVDAITEHQRLNTLMKGELIKGLLPYSSMRADYAVQRVRELAEGTCMKNYDYIGNGSGLDKGNKKWTECPTDSHLLLYLFCAFLEHPKWMLHIDPTSYSGAQSSKNPLFLGVLPPKERFPEKYVAVISGVPSVIHPGACILAVGKQSPPIFALYWEKKLQFSLQGRTALWDSVLLLCHRIKSSYGGVVRGVHLGSSAFDILPVLDLDNGE